MLRTLVLIALLLPTTLAVAQYDLSSRQLPNGQPLEVWENTTAYTRTYVVDQNHPAASDAHAGTFAEPLRTINRAAQLVGPGERVLIKSGVYREKIVPRRGGTGADAMISYETAPGARVIIKGSRVLPRTWSRSIVPVPGDGPWEPTFSEKLWMTELADSLFPEVSPFRIQNADEEDIAIMPWAADWAGRVPFTLLRGLLFQDGRRLVQLAAYEDLVRVPGSYWVDSSGTTVHVHPYGGGDPNGRVMEATVQQQLFAPDATGLGFIQVRGLLFKHAGNGFPRTGVGALFTRGGHHWIIENNHFEGINSVAVEIGARAMEVPDQEANRRDMERALRSPSAVIVRGNTITDAGTGGVQGYVLRNTLVEDNHLYGIGWQDVERYWENAAVKLLHTTNTLVRRNLIHDVQAGSAVWLDWDIRNSRITQNTIFDMTMCCNGALFIEASRVPNLIDNNMLWNIHGVPVYTGDTNELTVAHNLIGPSTGPGILSRVGTSRTLHGQPLTSKNNRFVHNVFYRSAPMVVEDADNTAAGNVFSAEFDLAAWQEQGFGAGSRTMNFEAAFDPESVLLHLQTPALFPLVESETGMPTGFYGQLRIGRTPAGPFASRIARPVTFDVDPRRPNH